MTIKAEAIPPLSPIHRAIMVRVHRQPGRWTTTRFCQITSYSKGATWRAVSELRRWGYLAPYDHTERPHGRWNLVCPQKP